MRTRDAQTAIGIRELAARPAARAGFVLVVLWLGSAILLRGTSEFGAMVAILVCASIALWASGTGRWFVVGQFVLWAALLAGTTFLLWQSSQLPGMLALFGAAAVWFVVAEPILRARRAG